jgi:sterol desaturase/sphingolipid hydroxylase (fatty acid hydroxylase superfamily)
MRTAVRWPVARLVHRRRRSLTGKVAAADSNESSRSMPIYLVFFFWLVVISAVVFTLERLFPSRPAQEAVREDFLQDLFWMVFNTQYVSWMLAIVTAQTIAWFNASVLHLGLPEPESLRLISHWPAWLQFIVFFLIRDFLDWNIHRWMHTIPWLWRFHQLHHSCEQLDWVASFRSHWGEIVVYQTIVYLPLVVLGVNDGVIFAIVVVHVIVQELSHANLRWDWGPLRYLISSPRFHAWHHDVECHLKHGQNFGITLVVWDWLFRTAYWPADKAAPERFGLDGTTPFPRGVWRRLWHPFRRRTALPFSREGPSKP